MPNRPPKPEPITTTRWRSLAVGVDVRHGLTSPGRSVPVAALVPIFGLHLTQRIWCPPACRGRAWPGSQLRRAARLPGPSRRVGGHRARGTMGRVTHFDLAIIGTGSGNSIVDERFADQRVAILEKGTFGGTCLNVGCIPTKMFVYPADVAYAAAHGDQLGVETRLRPGPLARDPRPDLRSHRPDPAGGRHWRADAERERHAVRGARPLRRRAHPRHRHGRDHHRRRHRDRRRRPARRPRHRGPRRTSASTPATR